MRRRMTSTLVVLLVTLSVAGWAQQDEARITVDFRGETLGQAMGMFARGYGLEYSLGQNVDAQTPVFATLVDVPLSNALTVILRSAGLTAVEQTGRWLITQQPQPMERPATQIRSLLATDSSRQPPLARTVAAYEPRRGAVEQGGEASENEEREEIMKLFYADFFAVDVLSEVFGGGVVEAGGYYGSGSYSGSSTSSNYNNSWGSNKWSNTNNSGSNWSSKRTWNDRNY
ncbi:MAG: hypothetical protein ACOX9R_04360 [Armatimonadota bacterium]